MRRSLSIALVVAVTVSVVWLGACGRTEPTHRDLPEDQRLRSPADRREDWLLKGARETLASDTNTLLEASTYSMCGICQAEHLLRALETSHNHSDFGPVAIAAFAGLDASKQPYLCVHGLVPLREVACFRLALSDTSGQGGTITIRMKQEYKSIEYITLYFFRTELVSWASLRDKFEMQTQWSLDYDETVPVPFPDSTDGLGCAVAVEDRRGRLSNFVPVTPYDAGAGD